MWLSLKLPQLCVPIKWPDTVALESPQEVPAQDSQLCYMWLHGRWAKALIALDAAGAGNISLPSNQLAVRLVAQSVGTTTPYIVVPLPCAVAGDAGGCGCDGGE